MSTRRTVRQFRRERQQGQERILQTNNLTIKRYINLDTAAYRDGVLSGKTKEMLGLVASMVLRCNDCIDYHLEQCVKHGYIDEEIEEAMTVALVVGGSVVIPHLRHARISLDELMKERDSGELPMINQV